MKPGYVGVAANPQSARHPQRAFRLSPWGQAWQVSRVNSSLVLIAVLIFSLEFLTAFETLDRIVTLVLGPITVFVAVAQFQISPRKLPRELWIYLIFIAWALVALPAVWSVGGYFRYWRRLVELFILATCVGVAVRKTGRISVILGAFLASGLIAGGYGYVTGDLQRALDPEYLARATGVYANPNGMAYVCFSGLIAALFFLDSTRGKTAQLGLGLAVALLEFAIIASASRGAFAASLVLFALWVLLLRRSLLLKSPLRLLGAILLGAVLYGVTQYTLSNTFLGTRFQRTTSARSFQELSQKETRANLIREGWAIALRHPFTGVGLNQIIYYTDRRLSGHSDLAEIPATTGFPGLLIYGVFVFALWKRVRRAEKLAGAVGHHEWWAARFPGLLIAVTVIVSPFKMTFYDLDSVILMAAALGYAYFLEDRAVSAMRWMRRSEILRVGKTQEGAYSASARAGQPITPFKRWPAV